MKKVTPTIATERTYTVEKEKDLPISSYFGEDTFNDKVMQAKLPKVFYAKLKESIDKGKKLDIETANAVAHAMKEWALENGATHFAHWFQPMTGATAEKHDAFIEISGPGEVIERFTGEQLVQGEPDASSFPSGGLRATFEARGYTAWDMSSPAFLRKNGIGITLCIPTAFISYHGEALDKKTPLLRSVRAVNDSAMRVLKVLGNRKSKKVTSNLGPEQEYFCIDMDYFYKRQDLVLTGRTLMGAPPAKGQELEDQYFGSIKERMQSFMHDVEEELYKLGIPAKTRHNEVAPAQFEIAPIFEEANVAVDHNLLVMDKLQQVARQHNMAVLLHEKPFAGINGSGKHVNWSLSTDDGINLFKPGKTPHDNIQFLVFLLATMKAVLRHSDLLRAAVASASNDHRLGANEAPPAIISIFLGDQLTKILESIEKGVASDASDKSIIDLGISSLPVVSRDNSDRNRTSPFAFTGNKFEFRAVGSSQNISFAATVVNTIIAESLDEVADMIEKRGTENIKHTVMEIMKEELPKVKPILFMGDNYTDEWHAEAERRKLPNMRTTPEALKSLDTEKASKLFEKYKVLSPIELKSRYTIKLEKYIKDIEIEGRALHSMVSSMVLPAAIRFQGEVASSIAKAEKVLGGVDFSAQKNLLKRIAELIAGIEGSTALLKSRMESNGHGHDYQKAAEFCNSDIKGAMAEIRKQADELEALIADDLWPMPKFWEMLFVN
ncbi:MAG: glutamine synthetase III [Spirochaetes bacterium]|nr:glutamine synthetase III [Spirochaetota bacterium]